ncbi:ATP-utilizing enzyme of the PP-loop superfamily [hydrothermal vent metagenome]|uniref:ATP-utilizing enzyme of the PP-loop superfamily n=1 Tax=hydrothermal vent metagenome TaxID=652676 RepID=A0A3B1DMH5_9ZZZZ
MTSLSQKTQKLLTLLKSYGSVAVAFSAGVDSTVVAKAAFLACGKKAIAVTSVSPSLATGEKEAAIGLAEQIGIEHRLIATDEFTNNDYLKNEPNRCYFCKTTLYNHLEKLLPMLEVDVIVNGANCDDLGDYRPGMLAATEHHVKSPLIDAGFTKADVRAVAKEWGLPIWDKPATPCLSSRLAYGVAVTPERLQRVDAAEQFLKQKFDLQELRVRHEANDLARIEVPVDALPRLLETTCRELITNKLLSLGFQYVTIDLNGFRSGSMNDGLHIIQ